MVSTVDLAVLELWLDKHGFPPGPVREPTVLTGGTQNILVRFRKSVLDKELRVNERHVGELVASMIPALLAEPGVGAISAAHLIIAWSCGVRKCGTVSGLCARPTPQS